MPIKGSPIENLKLKIENSLKNQSGFSGFILPLFLLAAIGLSVYLVQQRTNLIPFAQNTTPTPPNGCNMITLNKNNRYVSFKDAEGEGTGEIKSTGPEYEMPSRDNNFNGGKGADLRKYEHKDVVYKFEFGGDTWQIGTRKTKGADDVQKENVAPGEFNKVTNWVKYFECENLGFNANNNTCLTSDPGNGSPPIPSGGLFPLASMSHFDRPGTAKSWIKSPDGKKYETSGTNTDVRQIGNYRVTTFDNGRFAVYTRYKTGGTGTNEQGVPLTIGTNMKSYAGISFPVITQRTAEEKFIFAPKDPNSNVKCDGGGNGGGGAGNGGTGTKPSGAACTDGNECLSGTCTNKKCSGEGTKPGGAACTDGAECQSKTCTNKKCAGGSTVTGRACDENSDCASNKCINNRCAAVSVSPSPSSRPSPSTTASASPSASAVPLPSGTTVVSLTKAEITGFKSSFDALNARLPGATLSGNLKIVSGIANTELTSIVSALPTCPDDANVGKCVDEKFRTRFDLAKTAARLSAFYAIFNSIPGICVKADIGLNPLITATSQASTAGRVNLCTDRLVATKLWMVFLAGKFTPILSTDSRFPPNPTCATLPADVLSHYRNAESLFKTQAGFIQNTLCDGKTTVAPGGGI